MSGTENHAGNEINKFKQCVKHSFTIIFFWETLSKSPGILIRNLCSNPKEKVSET